MPVPGHVAPIATIVRALVQNGHEVVWYASRFFEARVTATGATFRPIVSTLDYGDSAYDRYFPERRRYSGLAQIKFDFKHIFIDAVPGYIKDLQAILDDGFAADVLIADPAVAAAGIVAGRRGLPWACVNISV